MKNRTIQEGVESYIKAVVPKTAGETQIKETKNAFYAGAFFVCQIMIDVSNDDISLDAGAAVFQSLLEECGEHLTNELFELIEERKSMEQTLNSGS